MFEDRIIIDPEIRHGKPVIKDTRVLISNILADLAQGLSFDQVIENYPNISSEDIKAALEFGSELAQFETVTMENT